MTHTLLRIAGLCWLAVVTITPAHATALIDHGHYTTDTASGLDWLDMSFTRGQSYNQVAQRLSGGDLDGWRFATSAEFDTLIGDVLGGPYQTGFAYSQYAAMITLIDLLGRTYGHNDYAYTVGFVDSRHLPMGDTRQFGFHSSVGGFVRGPDDHHWDAGFAEVHSMRGAFVVRSGAVAVPEPASLSLTAAGLLVLAARRRRR